MSKYEFLRKLTAPIRPWSGTVEHRRFAEFSSAIAMRMMVLEALAE